MIKKVKEKFSGKNAYWYKSTFFTISQRLSTLIFGVGSFLLLIQVLQKEEYGIWTLFLVIATILEVSRNGLIKSPLIRFLNDCDEGDKPSIFTASFIINISVAVIGATLMLTCNGFASDQLNAPLLAPLLSHYAFTTIILSLFFQFEFVQQAFMDFKGIFYAYFVRQGSFFLAVVYLFFFDTSLNNLEFLMYAYTGAIVLGTLVSYVFVYKFLIFSKSLEWEWVKKLLDYGKFTFTTNICSVILRGTDQLMLGAYVNPTAVANYNVAVRIANIIETPSMAISDVVFPKSVENMKTKGHEGVKILYEQSVGGLMALLIPTVIIVIFIPDFIINITSGGKYDEAIPILQVTAIYSLFIPASRQFANACNALNKPQWNFYLVLFSAILNLAFNYIFIHKYGVIGAAYGTLATYVISVSVSQLVLKKVIGVSLWNVFKHFKTPYLFMYQKITKS